MKSILPATLVMSLILGTSIRVRAANEGVFEIRVIDKDTQEPIAARIHLKDYKGKAIPVPKTVAWKDHFVFREKIALKLPPAKYYFDLERGPEYRTMSGYFVIEKNARDSRDIELTRFVDMKKEGWWSGDLHVHRPIEDMELLMDAEDLHVAPVISWWNKTNLWKDRELPDEPLVKFGTDHFYHVLAGEDEREGGALLYFHLKRPLEIQNAKREFPSSMSFLTEARQMSNEAHVDVEKPFWWDMPVWVASGFVDTIGIAHNHMQRDGMLDNEAWGKARDTTTYPSPLGNGRWTHDIYFHLLNSGIRLPPSAGSASGVLPNPVGYNRVYVHCGEELDYQSWWEGLKAGRVIVSNGPLLRPRFNDELPGHVFQANKGEKVKINIALNFSIRDKVSYMEVIKNGETIHEVRLEDYINKQGILPEVEFDESGWLLVRAVTDEAKTFRFGMTGPVYVEFDGEKRVSKQSAQFFADWVFERAKRLKIDDPHEKESVLKYLRQARDFWNDLVKSANAP